MISSQRFNSPGPCGLANWSPSQQPFQRKIPCSMVLYFIHSRTHPWWGTDQEWRRDTKGVQSCETALWCVQVLKEIQRGKLIQKVIFLPSRRF
ncbi:hypothetical protein VULLAG_LOCUS8977 [Vulpes lagopus]